MWQRSRSLSAKGWYSVRPPPLMREMVRCLSRGLTGYLQLFLTGFRGWQHCQESTGRLQITATHESRLLGLRDLCGFHAASSALPGNWLS